MFIFSDTPVKFVGLLLLFAFTAAWSAYESTRPQTGRQRISNVLHLLMSVVMLAMIAPVTWVPLAGVVGMPALIGLFVAGTVWFLVLALQAFAGRSGRAGRHFAGHAAMFGAMVWHLGGMAAMHAARGHGMGGSMGHGSMAGGLGTPMITAIVGVPFMVYLLWAAIADLRTALRPASAFAVSNDPETPPAPRTSSPGGLLLEERVVAAPQAAAEPDGLLNEHVAGENGCAPAPGSVTRARLARLAGFAMSFGMFWMSTGLLTPLLPFMGLLSF